MITAVIIDDEQKNVGTLTALLRDYCPQVTVVGFAHNVKEGKKLIKEQSPQIIFLDIEMPYGNGFDLLQSLPDLRSEIIFVTAFDQYAINAFRYAALDYLLKPVDIDQLMEAVGKAEKRTTEKNSGYNYELLLKNLEEKDSLLRSIAVTDKARQFYIKLADIMYIIAQGSYTQIFTEKRQFLTTRLLKEFETILPSEIFVRIHHSHIINKNFIAKIDRGRSSGVHMKDGKILEVATRRKDDFAKAMMGMCAPAKKSAHL